MKSSGGGTLKGKISENGRLNLVVVVVEDVDLVVVQEYVDDLQREHLADLLLGRARLLHYYIVIIVIIVIITMTIIITLVL